MLFSWVLGFRRHILWQLAKGWIYFLAMGVVFWFLQYGITAVLGKPPAIIAWYIYFYHTVVGGLSFVIGLVSLEIQGAWLREHRAEAWEDAELQAEIRQMAKMAGLWHVPTLVEMDGQVNAAATSSIFSQDAVISMGHITNVLSPRPRRAVFAHELSHIKHLDVFAQVIIQAGGRALSIQWWLIIIGLVASILFDGEARGYLFGALLLTMVAQFVYQLFALAHTRAREYLADIGSIPILGLDYRHDLIQGLLQVGVTVTKKHPLALMRHTGLTIFQSHPEVADRAAALGVTVAARGSNGVSLTEMPVA